jgi:DNA-binding beta-propeller fold protein YncE
MGTIDLPGKPEFAVSDGQGKIYDNLEDKGMICQIDASTMKVLNSWPLAPAQAPTGLAMDTKTHNLFSVCDGNVMTVVDAGTGKVTKTLAIGDGPDAAGFDAGLNRVYSSNSDGTMSVWEETDKNNFKLIENVVTQKRARTCAVNSKTHHIYLPTAEFEAAPAPTADKPHPKPKAKPGTFEVLDIAYKK